MTRKLSILFIIFVFALVSLPAADEPPKPEKPILKVGDVERFIKTFPLMKEEFEKFGAKYEAKSGAVTFPEAMHASQEFLGILKKHGWDENFFQKFSTIVLGYSAIVYGKEMTKAEKELAKSLKEIDTNPNIPESMKSQLKEQLKAASGIIKSQAEIMQKNIHPKDLLLIKPQVPVLKQVIEEDKNKSK